MLARTKGKSMPRVITKQLVCPQCGVVIADATYKRWPGGLDLVTPDGFSLQPEGVGIQLRRARSERQSAVSPAGADQVQARIEFLERNAAELVYDLRCRNGHSTLRTMPQLVRAIRTARGRWVRPT